MQSLATHGEGARYLVSRDITAMKPAHRRRFRKTHLGFVFQDPAANLLSYMTVLEHVEMAGHLRCREADLALLDHLEISELAGQMPVQLSAGQQQRVALAAAVTGKPDVVLADEPTAELDTQSAGLAVETLSRLREWGTTLVVTSHDPEVLSVADEVVRIERGVLVE